MTSFLLVLAVGLVAGCLSGVIGTGSSLMLLPALTYQFGPKHAVPVMAVAAVIANLSRVIAWWKEIDWKAVLAYAAPGVPAAALGARTLLALPPRWIDAGLGFFFLSMLALRRLRPSSRPMPLWALSLCGAAIGFLTGLVLSTGPLSVPVFTSYGLVGGPFLGTEAMTALALYLSKVTTFREAGALSGEIVVQGLIVGASLMIGTFIGKGILSRIPGHRYAHLIDALVLCSGVSLLWAALSNHA
ncbi:MULTISPECIES: sulfite exporter TauE/SafE family protein [Luteibacter]|uniref:sulfite exporter TauE/SafE family protein n=1 Tax=Luteibacter sp. dw_328 TaxID=2719796 RepID=UPI0007BEA95B|nr:MULTISPECIES: sulfite exporter TauE/SafE family protein [Luteibacter]